MSGYEPESGGNRLVVGGEIDPGTLLGTCVESDSPAPVPASKCTGSASGKKGCTTLEARASTGDANNVVGCINTMDATSDADGDP